MRNGFHHTFKAVGACKSIHYFGTLLQFTGLGCSLFPVKARSNYHWRVICPMVIFCIERWSLYTPVLWWPSGKKCSKSDFELGTENPCNLPIWFRYFEGDFLHGHRSLGTGFFARKKALKNSMFSRPYVWLRGPDLNWRPSGYEPDELPLLHPALMYHRPFFCCFISSDPANWGEP